MDPEQLKIVVVGILEEGPATGLTVDQIKRQLKPQEPTLLSQVVETLSKLHAQGTVFFKGDKENEDDDKEPVVVLAN